MQKDDKSYDFEQKKKVEEFSRLIFSFQADSDRARANAKDTYIHKEPELHSVLRIILDELIVRTSKQLFNKINNATDKISYQLSLIASFVRTHFIINDMILNGDLIEAFTLIRKQLEVLTRLREIDNKPLLKLMEKTPNVKNLFGNEVNEIYKDLSEIAHFSKPRVGELLTIYTFEDSSKGPSLFPAYNNDSLACYNRHSYVSICFNIWFIEFLKNHFGETYNSDHDDKTIYKIIKIAEECNIIQQSTTV